MAIPIDIVLGDGIFSIGASSTTATAIGLTRGGGNFTLEREYRQIEADGDYMPVKGRIRLIKEVAKLNIKSLEIAAENCDDYFPAISASITTTATSGTTATISTKSLTTNVTTEDYHWVQWVGYNKGGEQVMITLENAINLENINWDLVDKEEVINELTYTACSLETARTTAPWKIYICTTSS